MYELPDCFKDYLPKDNSNLEQDDINKAMLNSDIDNPSQSLLENKVFVEQMSSYRKADLKETCCAVKMGRCSNEDFTETTYIPPHKTGKAKRRLNLKYSMLEGQEILNGHMLTDMTINLAQNILVRDFATISGFEDTAVGTVLNFSTHDGDSPYIQMLHTGSLHWVCISNISQKGLVKADVVNLYDSLNTRGTVTAHVHDQIADFLDLPSAPEIHLDIQPVQQEKNGTNCGVFLNTYAVDLANLQDPTEIRYDERKMRKHLHDCLQAERLEPFPREERHHCYMQREIKRKNISLFCICCKPLRKGAMVMKCSHSQRIIPQRLHGYSRHCYRRTELLVLQQWQQGK